MRRRLAVGAEPHAEGTHFRLWAPRHERVAIAIEGRDPVPLSREEGGWFSGSIAGAGAGARYRIALAGEPSRIPDPFSRSQPEGPHAPSEVIDPTRFAWTDRAWRGRSLRDAVIYELHVGTFTPEGTWRAAIERLPHLASLGITVVEMMPVCEFAGRWGWGYDGVSLFAPFHGYGRPDDLRAFVDRAHALGIAVILDVVYNHLGPDGNYLATLAPDCFTDRYETDWGVPIDFDGPASDAVREIFLANVRHWIAEHHFDGLRLDATQNVYDFGDHEHVLAAIARTVREAAGGRETLVIGENECQHVELIERHGLDALWNDDLHHSAVVALTGRNEAYYGDHRGTAQEIVSAIKHGYLFQGQRYEWQQQRRGTPSFGIDRRAFVTFLENHDQVANTLDGRRLHALTSRAKHRATTALLLLAPGTPMLFQGEEMLSSVPFLYFCDHHPGLAPLVRKGRGEFLAQFPSIDPSQLDDPGAPSTFERCKLDWRDLERSAAHVEMVRALLALRRSDPVIARHASLDGAVLAGDALVIRMFGAQRGDDRLIVTNLGRSRELVPCPEPLLAPPRMSRWRTIFASEDPRWGGRGAPPVEHARGLRVTAESTVVLAPEPDPDQARRFGPPEKKNAREKAAGSTEGGER